MNSVTTVSKGMKWGVRMDRYKAMSRSERKSTKMDYLRKNPEKRLKRGTEIGGMIGAVAGGVPGAVAGAGIGYGVTKRRISKELLNTKISNVDKKTVERGREFLSESKKSSGSKPYYAMSSKEQAAIDKRYEAQRKTARDKLHAAKTPEERARLLKKYDDLERDYVNLRERDW